MKRILDPKELGACVKRHGPTLYRVLLSVLTVLVAVLTRGDTERIAPFAIAMVIALCIGLVLLRRTRYLTLIFLELSLLLIFCYDSFSFFIEYVWLLPIAVVALTVHLVRLCPRFSFGASFLPLAAVALATMLGGVGMIGAGDYFRPASLVFMIGLGPGLLLCYWILKNEAREDADEEALLSDLCFWGMSAALIVFAYMLPALWEVRAFHLLPSVQWSNNVSTMLLIAMPATVCWAHKQSAGYLLAFGMFGALMLSGSRGGQLFAGVELVICCVAGRMTERDPVKRIWAERFCAFAVMVAVYAGVLMAVNGGAFGIYNPEEVRWKLVERSFANFRENPLFGSGLGYLGNADLYDGKAGTINWYHCFPAQVLGGLGIFGVLAWGWQLINRLRLSIAVRKDSVFLLALCYLGLLLMSMVNPGEFCPIPYAYLAVFFFVMTERKTAIATNPFQKKHSHEETA